MTEKNILIAGLPDAGKSSYIAALNGVMNQEGDFSLSPADGKKTEWKYVDAMTEKWLDCKEVDHSTDDETKFIKWPLKRKDGQVFDITIPDMKGEIYYDIINNELDSRLSEFCEQAHGILFFVNNMNRFLLKDHVMTLVKDEENGVEVEDKIQSGLTDEFERNRLNVSTMPDVTKNLLVLRYLRQIVGNVKLVIAVSSWDEKQGFSNVEDYFKKICPAIYNYVRFNFDSYKFYGVSAQGVKYGKQDANFNKLTETGKRAYVFTNEKIYDLSHPLDFLISE